MKTATAILALTMMSLSVAGVCRATVVAVHDGGQPVTPGYTGYTLSLVSDNQYLPAGFSGLFWAEMNQLKAFGALDTPTLTNANLIGPPFGEPEQDSHFLVNDADILAGVDPWETSTGLGGAFAWKVSARSNPLPWAYLVVPDGGQVHFRGTATDASATAFEISSVPWGPHPPEADADGPYVIDVGEALALDAGGTYDVDEDVTSYMWDLDGDGSFETDAGSQAVFTVSYAELESLGLGGGGQYAIELLVTDFWDLQDTAGTTLTIIPEPATPALLAFGGLALIRRRRA